MTSEILYPYCCRYQKSPCGNIFLLPSWYFTDACSWYCPPPVNKESRRGRVFCHLHTSWIRKAIWTLISHWFFMEHCFLNAFVDLASHIFFSLLRWRQLYGQIPSKSKNSVVTLMYSFWSVPENLSVYFTAVLRNIITCFIKYNQY